MSYVLKGNIPLLLLLLFILLFLFIIILIIEVFLFPFCFLVVLPLFFLFILFILIFIISLLLQGVQGAPLLLTAEISLKSRPSSARRFCSFLSSSMKLSSLRPKRQQSGWLVVL